MGDQGRGQACGRCEEVWVRSSPFPSPRAVVLIVFLPFHRLLNLSSRSLAAIPPTLYSSLLPRTSPYHPASRQSSSFRREPTPDLRISSLAEDADGSRTATWYEQQELRSLNLSSNEIGKLDEEIGGFEDLEFLDVRPFQTSSPRKRSYAPSCTRSFTTMRSPLYHPPLPGSSTSPPSTSPPTRSRLSRCPS